jgi:hypothetical protein
MRGIAVATGSHLWIISGALMRMPMRKIAKSPFFLERFQPDRIRMKPL